VVKSGRNAICQQHGLRIIKALQDEEYELRAFVFEGLDTNRIYVGQLV
jgi:hypothetical protein